MCAHIRVSNIHAYIDYSTPRVNEVEISKWFLYADCNRNVAVETVYNIVRCKTK